MTQPLIRVEALSKHFVRPRSPAQIMRREPPTRVAALNGVSITVERGETLAIVGESGCGKSTLARCLVRLHRMDSGRITYDGVDVGALRGPALRQFNRRVQMV